MRKTAVLAVSATAAVVVLGFTLLGGSPARAGRPALRVVRDAPLTVRGERFRSRERVRVTAAAKVVRTKANGDGVFVVTIRGASRCDTARVLARGSAGSYAIVKLLPSPECLPARSG